MRSVRISDEVWRMARERAEREENATISHVVSLLVEAYAKGLIRAPKVVLSYEGDDRNPAGVA